MKTTPEITAFAEELRRAERERKPIVGLYQRSPSLNEDDAYAIQCLNAQWSMKNGRRLVGYKVGLTSREAQKHFNVYEPDFGHLFEDMSVEPDGELVLSELIQPKIEGEIAFVMAKELKGPGVTASEARKAVDSVVASMEIIDSRIENWKITAVDTISDNGSSAKFVLSKRRSPLSELTLPSLGMALSKNGEVELTAAGAAVLGDPLEAVVFLANILGKHGMGLKPGEIVLSGSLGGMVKMADKDRFTCEFQKLGSVSVKVTS